MIYIGIFHYIQKRFYIVKVIHLAKKTSRLTNGINKKIPITHYSISYLYRDKYNKFIRGWHGIKHNAFYLPEVLLENVYNNGTWIKYNDKHWPKLNNFNIDETLSKLVDKAGYDKNKDKIELFYNNIIHFKI